MANKTEKSFGNQQNTSVKSKPESVDLETQATENNTQNSWAEAVLSSRTNHAHGGAGPTRSIGGGRS